jgi:hypothetical protein
VQRLPLVVLLAALLAGCLSRADGDPAPAARSAPDVSSPGVQAEIVVVQEDGRSRTYSSHQLPPDGRLVFARFASDRAREADRPPDSIAEWIFRVVPDAEEIRITVRPEGADANDAAVAEAYSYRRETFVPS